MMEVTYLNTTLDFERFFLRYQGEYFRKLLKEKPFESLSMLFVLCAMLVFGHKIGGLFGACVSFGLIIGFPFFGFKSGRISHHLAHRMVENRPQSITEEKTVGLSDAEISLRAPYMLQHEHWSNVESIDGRPPYIFIKSPKLAVAIPATAFSSESDRQLFLDFAIEAFRDAHSLNQGRVNGPET